MVIGDTTSLPLPLPLPLPPAAALPAPYSRDFTNNGQTSFPLEKWRATILPKIIPIPPHVEMHQFASIIVIVHPSTPSPPTTPCIPPPQTTTTTTIRSSHHSEQWRRCQRRNKNWNRNKLHSWPLWEGRIIVSFLFVRSMYFTWLLLVSTVVLTALQILSI
jgi:hypothetical protein